LVPPSINRNALVPIKRLTQERHNSQLGKPYDVIKRNPDQGLLSVPIKLSAEAVEEWLIWWFAIGPGFLEVSSGRM